MQDGRTPEARRVGEGGRPPAPRPTWMVVFGAVMLVSAFHLFQNGLEAWSAAGVANLGDFVTETGLSADDPQAMQLALARGLADTLSKINPLVMRAYGASKLVFAALLLLAVAALFTHDARARRASIVAGWFGVAYNIGNAVFFIRYIRGGLIARLAEWQHELPALSHLGPDDKPEMVTAWINAALVAGPIAVSVIGATACLVMISYFGGRRGRAFYGVTTAARPTSPPPQG